MSFDDQLALSRRGLMTGAAAAGLATVTSTLPREAVAKAPLIGAERPSYYRFDLGDFEVTTLLIPGHNDSDEEVKQLEDKAAKSLRDIYTKLTPWEKTQVARHPERPHFLDYINGFIEDFVIEFQSNGI